LLAKISFPNIAQICQVPLLLAEETKRLAIATSQNWEIQIGWFFKLKDVAGSQYHLHG
jgi:hypothetical protein